MRTPHLLSARFGRCLTAVLAGGAALAALPSSPAESASAPSSGGATTTPIKHVVVIIGENHTFDNVFGTYSLPPARACSTCCLRAS